MLYQFLLRGLLRLFLKAIEQHYQITFIKTAKYPVDIAAILYPYFIESIICSHVREKLCWNSLKNHNHIKYFINLAFNLFRKLIEKVIKIVLVENQCSFFLHAVKLTNNGTKKLIIRCEKMRRWFSKV
jgi:predicted transcriptional regulator